MVDDGLHIGIRIKNGLKVLNGVDRTAEYPFRGIKFTGPDGTKPIGDGQAIRRKVGNHSRGDIPEMVAAAAVPIKSRQAIQVVVGIQVDRHRPLPEVGGAGGDLRLHPRAGQRGQEH